MRAALEKHQQLNNTRIRRKYKLSSIETRVMRQRAHYGQYFRPRILNNKVVCAYCNNNQYTVKSGFVYGKQRYYCRWCDRRFTFFSN